MNLMNIMLSKEAGYEYTIKDFFRPHTFLKTPRIWVICQPGADSSRRRERRWPDR